MTNRELFLRYVAQTSDAPLALEIERAEGIYLFDTSQNKYIDAISGISVSNVGHCHPHVVQAIQVQAAKFMHLMVYGEYIYTPQVLLCKKIASLLPASLNNVYLVNSGAEATEGAMKLAKRYTGRNEFVAFTNSYHGSTQGALSLMGSSYFKDAYRPLLPGIQHVSYNDMLSLQAINKQTAAVFFEPIQAESGVQVPNQAFVKALRARCNEMGALLVFDEIQTGFGRTGSWFAFQQFDIVPDIILLAKGMGGGLPIGCFVASDKIMQCLSYNPLLGHITTFGGNPVTSAAALACIEVIESEKLVNSVEAKGKHFDIIANLPGVKAFRRVGLLMAIEVENDVVCREIIKKAFQKNIITDWFLFAPHCIRLAPPLIINEKEIKQIVSVFIELFSV